MGRRSRTDRVEAALRHADATLAAWLRRTARVVRRRVEGLQGGLKRLSTGLGQLEKDRKHATTEGSERPATSRRATARTRKPKKAA